MQYLFQTEIPLPWLLMDVLTVLITVLVILFIVQKSEHPLPLLLESFGFVFLYASIYENFAVVQGWYIYGRSFLMIGDVPLSVPLIELDVFLISLWMLEKMKIPDWCKPFIVGLMGMLQDFSLDPVSVRQVFITRGIETGRWTWLIEPWMANIYDIPVYNFPGWMLIMLYAAIFVLIGRAWYKKSNFKTSVGILYPILAFIFALLTMVSPLSQFLLWLAPFGSKGSNFEWIMLAFHLIFPLLLLLIFWQGKMKTPLTLKEDYPVLVTFIGFHLADILCTIKSGYAEILWLVVLTSAVHALIIAWIFLAGRKPKLVKGDA